MVVTVASHPGLEPLHSETAAKKAEAAAPGAASSPRLSPLMKTSGRVAVYN